MLIDPIWEYKAHPELKEVLKKLQARFGPRLRVLKSTPEWLTFEVYGLTDENLIRILEREQTHFFGGNTLHHQVFKQLAGQERGVSVRFDSGLSPESGFWYY